MKIISFSGVDGSGKSTQRELLHDYLESSGYKTAYFHATEFSLANRWLRKKRKQEKFVPGSEAAVTEATLWSIFLRLFFLLLDGARFQNYERCLKKSGVNALLSDRFFQDSLINICYLSENRLVRLLVKIMANILPLPDYRFYLKISAEEVIKRARVPEQGQEYLEQKIQLYNKPPFSWHYTPINGSDSPGTIHQTVISQVADI